jgi:serum/glucocorticoid-regulated kinase 2
MYQLIMHNGVVKYPSYIPQDAHSLLEGLLTRDPQNRFGAEEVRKHPFFAKHYDWDKMEKCQIEPPFKPIIRTESEDTKYFYKEFTSEDFRNESVCEPFNPEEVDFRNFSFEQKDVKPVHDEKW